MSTATHLNRDYEGLFLFGTGATAKVDDALNLVRSFVEKHGGQISVLKKWDDRKLAYEVAKQTRGLYVLTYFTSPTSAVAQIEREVRLNDEILRCLITDGSHLTVDEVEAMEPQKPEPRESREDDDFGAPRGGFRPRRDDRGPREEASDNDADVRETANA